MEEEHYIHDNGLSLIYLMAAKSILHTGMHTISSLLVSASFNIVEEAQKFQYPISIMGYGHVWSCLSFCNFSLRLRDPVTVLAPKHLGADIFSSSTIYLFISSIDHMCLQDIKTQIYYIGSLPFSSVLIKYEVHFLQQLYTHSVHIYVKLYSI